MAPLLTRSLCCSNTLYVQFAVPIHTEDIGESSVSWNDGQMESVSKVAETLHLTVVGWYHSHPNQSPNPSIIDIGTMTGFTGSAVDDHFIGLIIAPYHVGSSSRQSLFAFFRVDRTYEKGLGLSAKPISIPVFVGVHPGGTEQGSDWEKFAAEKLLKWLQERLGRTRGNQAPGDLDSFLCSEPWTPLRELIRLCGVCVENCQPKQIRGDRTLLEPLVFDRARAEERECVRAMALLMSIAQQAERLQFGKDEHLKVFLDIIFRHIMYGETYNGDTIDGAISTTIPVSD